MAQQITLRWAEQTLAATRLRITDTQREPLAICPSAIEVNTDSLSARLVYPGEPFGLAYPLAVPGFGRVYLWADGKGYNRRECELLLERELAISRYQRSSAFIKQYQRKGVPLDEVQTRLDAAKPPDKGDTARLLQSLRESLLAGEQAVSAVAHFRLARIGWREAFLWGAILTDPATPITSLHPPFNQLSLSMTQQPPEAWEPVVQQAQQERLLIRAESLITAAFIRQAIESPQPLQEHLTHHLRNTLSHYRGRIRYWEVLSDLPDSLELVANETRSRLSLVSALCEAARTIDFGVIRLLGATYSLHRRRATFKLLEQLVESEVPFEGINLHLDWRDFDLLDLDWVIEHYGDLGKPLHLTLHPPLATTNSDEGFFWHASPSAAIQADWLQRIFTLAMSKPFIVGVQIALHSVAESTIHRLHEQRQAWKQQTPP